MERRKIKWREPAPTAQINQLLANHYNKLLKWGAVLTRGDAEKAEEIVHELCLYFVMTKPDLSDVANLDGYLYTCLRHIYLSGMARSSRESLHFISVADFDSFAFALGSNQTGDLLQRQNDLRRICAYTVWRKESSKGASYFILHFFHGYTRHEVAELARLPISGIYNKLKIARAEVKSYLGEPGKLRMVNGDYPPEPGLSWSLSSSRELFRELRTIILHARVSDCLPEEALLAHYGASASNPIPCSLLAHLVSCEPCLAIVDHHFRRPTLQSREPLDGSGFSSDTGDITVGGVGAAYQKAALLSVHQHWRRVHDHRPKTLSIAVNGKIIASHDVRAEHSNLSARIEHPANVEFIEVFSEQDVRLALLSISETPPDGPHTRTQRIEFSDARWLELNLSFDGMGLSGQVDYFDPALADEAFEEDEEESPAGFGLNRSAQTLAPNIRFWPKRPFAAFARLLRAMAPSSAIAWALMLAVAVTAGYLVFHHASESIDAKAILSESVRIETANLWGQTEHQVLQIEELSSDGQVLQQGIVDLWKDGDDRRYLRRLYDSNHRMVAAEWRNKDGEHRSRRKGTAKDSLGKHSPLLMNEFWDHDLSAHAFSLLAGSEAQVHSVEGGYELTAAGPIEGHPQVVSATLVLDRRLAPVRATMRIRSGNRVSELRFVQQEYDRRPSASVPDTMFAPQNEYRPEDWGPVHQHNPPNTTSSNIQLAELQIAVLYQLNRLSSDTGEPIEVIRTPEGRLRISGTVGDDALKQKIASQLQTLPNHQLLDLRLFSRRDAQVQIPALQRIPPGGTRVYDINQTAPPAYESLRKYFLGKGLSGERLDSAVAQSSQDTLAHAQVALQHVYALDRLGNALSTAELTSIDPSSQRQWTEMAAKHASELASELRALREQLAEVLGEQLPNTDGERVPIENPVQFKEATDQLLHQMQNLNRSVGTAFASHTSGENQLGPDALLRTVINAIPLPQAEAIARFTTALNTSAKAQSVDRHNGQDAPNDTSSRPQ
jgi:DNA-directed RNA polymerase specialized sigma24 family protein